MKYTKSMGSGVWCWVVGWLGFLSSFFFFFGVDSFILSCDLALDGLDEGVRWYGQDKATIKRWAPRHWTDGG